MNFIKALRAQWAQGNMVCMGLDSDYKKIPEHVRNDNTPASAVLEFNQALIRSTWPYICAVKPNIAFYSGMEGTLRRALAATCECIRDEAPEVPIILDYKRGDIGNTNVGYVEEAEEFGADAVTVNPYMGHDPLAKDPSFKVFLENPDRGVIVLCRTSNPDAAYFQDRLTQVSEKELDWVKQRGIGQEELGWFLSNNLVLAPHYQLRAIDVAQNWNAKGNCALVVGATVPQQLAAVRRLVGDMPILVPGIGAQGGDLEATLKAGLTGNGDGLVINASRSITFAAKDYTYPTAAKTEVERLNTAIRNFRESQKKAKQ